MHSAYMHVGNTSKLSIVQSTKYFDWKFYLWDVTSDDDKKENSINKNKNKYSTGKVKVE